MTKYPGVRDELVDRLESMAAGEQLPPERELAASLGISRATLRRALDELVAAGAARRRPGAGVFAVGPKISPGLQATSFTADMKQRGLHPSSRVIAFDQAPAGARIGRRLTISPGDPMLTVTRLRLADAVPMAIEQLHVPASLVPGLGSDDLRDASFYELLHSRYGVEIAGGTQTIEPTVTDENESAQLEVPLHSPAFLFERTSRDDAGRVVEYVRSVYRGDRYRISAEISPPPIRGAVR